MSTRRLFRMVVRVEPDLSVTLNEVVKRLLAETRCTYSLAAVVRGLVVLGLREVSGAPHIAGFFAGSRVKRGRKRGERRAPAVLDLDR